MQAAMANYVGALTVIEGGSSNIKCPSGYVKKSMDLNKKAGGKYIYLCVKYTTSSNNAIRDLTAISGWTPHVNPWGPKCPSSLSIIDVDLNKGSGGKFIYFCYGDKGVGTRPIKDVNFVSGSFFSNPSNIKCPAGQEKIEQDLNEGVTITNPSKLSDYIYTCVAR
jgi:hypothetical protein